MFPQGDMTNASNWEIKRHLAFTAESAPQDGQYVMGMVADNHMTMGISYLSTRLSNSMGISTQQIQTHLLGAPDGAYHYSTGPDIE